MTQVQALRLEWVAASDRFAVKLKGVMTVQTKADRLDEAIAIRTLIDSLAAEKGGSQRIALVHSAKAKLPEDTAKLTDALIEKAKEAEELFRKSLKAADEQLAKLLEEIADKAVLGDDVEVARKSIHELSGARSSSFPYYWAGHYSNPLKLVSSSSDIFAELQKESSRLREKVQEREEPLRKELISKLQKIEEGNLKAEVELAIRRALQSLTIPDFLGLRGTLLFYIDPDLTDESLAVAKQYQRDVLKMIEEARLDLRVALDKIRPRLLEARKVHLEAPKDQPEKKGWEAAFSAMESAHTMPRLFEPFSIKYGGPRSDQFVWDGAVAGAFLVINVHNHEEWIARDRIRVRNETSPHSSSPRQVSPFSYRVIPSLPRLP